MSVYLKEDVRDSSALKEGGERNLTLVYIIKVHREIKRSQHSWSVKLEHLDGSMRGVPSTGRLNQGGMWHTFTT